MENPQNQVAQSISSANNLLVTVSNNPSVDQLAAAIGLALLLNKMGKHATAVFSGQVPSTIEFLEPEKTLEKNTDSLRDFIIALDKAKADKLRYKVEDKLVKIFITPYRTSIDQKDLEFSQGDFNVDAVVALGVKQKEQLDQAITSHGRILHDAVVISINNDTSGELGSQNWVDTAASSLCEMVVSLIDLMKKDKELLDTQTATAFLTGIVAETQRFSNAKTNAKTMTISSELMAAGANQQLIATKLEPTRLVGKTDTFDPSKLDELVNETDDSATSSDGAMAINHDQKDDDQGDDKDQATEGDDWMQHFIDRSEPEAKTPDNDENKAAEPDNTETKILNQPEDSKPQNETPPSNLPNLPPGPMMMPPIPKPVEPPVDETPSNKSENSEPGDSDTTAPESPAAEVKNDELGGPKDSGEPKKSENDFYPYLIDQPPLSGEPASPTDDTTDSYPDTEIPSVPPPNLSGLMLSNNLEPQSETPSNNLPTPPTPMMMPPIPKPSESPLSDKTSPSSSPNLPPPAPMPYEPPITETTTPAQSETTEPQNDIPSSDLPTEPMPPPIPRSAGPTVTESKTLTQLEDYVNNTQPVDPVYQSGGDKTLTDLERYVQSPHLSQQLPQEPSMPPSMTTSAPPVQSQNQNNFGAQVDNARNAVDQAMGITNDTPMEPISALNASPVDLDLGHANEPAAPGDFPTDSTLPQVSVNSNTGVPRFDLPGSQPPIVDTAAQPLSLPPASPLQSSVPPPPPVPPPMMPSSYTPTQPQSQSAETPTAPPIL